MTILKVIAHPKTIYKKYILKTNVCGVVNLKVNVLQPTPYQIRPLPLPRGHYEAPRLKDRT